MRRPLSLLLCTLLVPLGPGSLMAAEGASERNSAPFDAQASPPKPASPPVFVPGAAPDIPVPINEQGTASGPLRAIPGIRILVLEGKMKVNRLTEGIFAMPVVEIRDANDRPIEGAQVTFILNGGTGAGASFRDGSLEKVFASNAQGQAAAEGYVPNAVEGKFNVRVRAKYQEDTTEVVIPQASSFQTQMEADQKKKGAWKKWLWIGGAVAAGAVTTGIILSRRSDSSAPPVVVVTPGPPVLGGR